MESLSLEETAIKNGLESGRNLSFKDAEKLFTGTNTKISCSENDLFQNYCLLNGYLSLSSETDSYTLEIWCAVLDFFKLCSQKFRSKLSRVYLLKSIKRLVVSVSSFRVGFHDEEFLRKIIDICTQVSFLGIDCIYHDIAEIVCCILRSSPESYAFVLTMLKGCSSKIMAIILKSGITSRSEFIELITNDSEMQHFVFSILLPDLVNTEKKNIVDIFIKLKLSYIVMNELDKDVFFDNRSNLKPNLTPLLKEVLILNQSSLQQFSLDQQISLRALVNDSKPKYSEVYSLEPRLQLIKNDLLGPKSESSDKSILSLIFSSIGSSPKIQDEVMKMLKLIPAISASLSRDLIQLADIKSDFRLLELLLELMRMRKIPFHGKTCLNIALSSTFQHLKAKATQTCIACTTEAELFAMIPKFISCHHVLEYLSTPEPGVLGNFLVFFSQVYPDIVETVFEGFINFYYECDIIKNSMRLVEVLGSLNQYLLMFSDDCPKERAFNYYLYSKCKTMMLTAFKNCESECPEKADIEMESEDFDLRYEWRVIHSCADILATLCKNNSREQNFTDSLMIFDMMIRLKHRGAFSSLYSPLCTIQKHSLAVTCEGRKCYIEMIRSILLSPSKNDSMTRRSGGLPLATKSIIMAHDTQRKICFDEIMNVIFKEINEKDRSDFVLVRSMNILREFIRDRCLDDYSAEVVVECLRHCFQCFDSSCWDVRNGALMLYSSIHLRMVNVNLGPSGVVDIRKLTSIFGIHLCNVFTEQLSRNNKDCTYPLLVVFEKIDFSNIYATPIKEIVELRRGVEKFAQELSRSPSFHIRVKATRIWKTLRSCNEVLSSQSVNIENAFKFLRKFSYIDQTTSESYQSFFPRRFFSYLSSQRIARSHGVFFENFDGIQQLSLDFKQKNERHIAKILDLLLNDMKSYMSTVYSQLSESSPESLRIAASEHLLQNYNPTEIGAKQLKVAYKMCLDDSEDVRFIGCQFVSKLFKTGYTQPWYTCVEIIWHFVSMQESALQKDYFVGMFFDSFFSDVSREISNAESTRLFLVEPLNCFRDYLIECQIMTKFITPFSFALTMPVIHPTSVHLERHRKCLKVLGYESEITASV